MKTKISKIIFILALVCLIAFNISSAKDNDNPNDTPYAKRLYLTYGMALISLNKFYFKELTAQQIEEIKNIQNEAISKIVSSVDKYGWYYTTEEWREIMEEEQKEFEGVRMIYLSISAKMVNPETGYIILKDFHQGAGENFKRKVGHLKSLGMKKMVLDLRNNPGGNLMEADKILEALLPAGRIEIYSLGGDGQFTPFYSPPENKVPKIFTGKIAILINENSASASELVTVSLKEQVSAIVIGKKSYGKGSIQTFLPLPDGSVLRLTTAHYLSPVLGEDIEGKGIIPDIEINDNPDTPEDEAIQKAIEALNN